MAMMGSVLDEQDVQGQVDGSRLMGESGICQATLLEIDVNRGIPISAEQTGRVQLLSDLNAKT